MPRHPRGFAKARQNQRKLVSFEGVSLSSDIRVLILGINAYHGDSSACVLRDGKLVAAAEEERFRRIKHWAGFPSEAVRYCLSAAGANLADVGAVAINQDAGANLWRKIAFAATFRPRISLLVDRVRNRQKRTGVLDELQHAFPSSGLRAELVPVEHHLAHLGSTFLVSPFDEAVVVSVDGFGDFASAAWGIGTGTRIGVQGRIHFPHSLGIFYQAITQYLGFLNYGDEYKVMGLAPYGQPIFLESMRQIVRLESGGAFRLELDYFRHHREKIAYEWESGEPHVGALFSAQLERLLGPARASGEPLSERHRNVAHSAQAMYEEAFFHLLRELRARHQSDALALSGGCALNSVANGKVYSSTGFHRLYVPAAAGDAGGAIGAAVVAWSRIGGARHALTHAYWGPEFSDADHAALLAARRERLGQASCRVAHLDENTLAFRTAEAIAAGDVVGWFQGKMEWGPRALGNRSILADPRRADMKEVLNRKIKRRESFRPFAPSILREAVADWFECDDDVPFMTQVYPVKASKRAAVPAVTHVDGSGRLQTVERATNPRFHALISAFAGMTGVPMVLNTSFNENEPVVCKPEEALDCFLRTRMDCLVLGNYFVSRVQT